ncbi:hypothetical protein PB01_20550 [Psychrobacillus glaciei]|uniref:Uncharacterized protein n=1 Tax=Psychrobacillus glaciei TaxID=2283160 RepID=A0A5J6STV0_9BACI|nr:hypothetical protein [Psychrobacillus glaciei]QFG00990.1 hypothetical protein PB01_20550 [Psychrobacillus glaciei]
MEIQWLSGQYSEDNRIFDSLFEAYEWTDSLYPEFLIYLVNKVNVGYATPDEKIIDYLTDFIPKWADYLNVKVTVIKEVTERNGKYIYKIWTSYSRES